MDLLYVVNKRFSYCGEHELRWSLRSIEKFGKGIENIFIVGDIPEFINDNVVKIPHKDKFENPKNKIEVHANITDHILYAINSNNISSDFVVSMDDHYILKDVDYNDYPFYVKDADYGSGISNLPEEIEDGSDYIESLVHTSKILIKYGLPTKNFILHRNFKCNKDIWNECSEKFSEFTSGVEPFAFTLNYQYSKNPFEFVKDKDVKLTCRNFETKDYSSIKFLSSYDLVEYCRLFDFLESLYKNKSSYEK